MLPIVTKETGIRVIGVFRRSKLITLNVVVACQARRQALAAEPWHGKIIRKLSVSMANMVVRVSEDRLMALWKRSSAEDRAAYMDRRSMNFLK